MRVSKSTAIKAVKSLVKKGVLIVTHRKNSNGGDTSNLYTIKGFNSQNKKAPSTPIEDASNQNRNNKSNDIINQSDTSNVSIDPTYIPINENLTSTGYSLKFE